MIEILAIVAMSGLASVLAVGAGTIVARRSKTLAMLVTPTVFVITLPLGLFLLLVISIQVFGVDLAD